MGHGVDGVANPGATGSNPSDPTDATLLSAKAPRLDRMVAAAARSWRYRPFEAAGQPTAFCHGVVIQYEHW